MSSERPKENEITETDALLKLIEIGKQEFEKGEYQSADDFLKEMESDENFSPQQAKKNDLSHKQG
jgi:outer membrane protein assembly factor BamD (BamD/ComL family)